MKQSIKDNREIKIKLKYSWNRYVLVRLFDNREELRVHFRDSSICGIYNPNMFVVWPKVKISKEIGIININRQDLGIGVISHEVCHFIFDWVDKFNHLKNNDIVEEKACWLFGDVLRQIVNWLYEIKVYKQNDKI